MATTRTARDQTHCLHGHDLTDPANIYSPPAHPTWRCCVACRLAWRAERALHRRYPWLRDSPMDVEVHPDDMDWPDATDTFD